MKPTKIYAELLEATALEQFNSAMEQDFAVKGALMPDAHTGYSLPIGGNAAEALQQYIDRIEKLAEEQAALAEDVKQVYEEAKSTGFSQKTIRRIVRERKADKEKLRLEQEEYELYSRAIDWDIFA